MGEMNPNSSHNSNPNFIRDYIRLYQGTEVPEVFLAWAAVAGISAVLGRRVWLDMGTFCTYPNMFIVFVGGSGRVRKSTAVNLMEDLLRDVTPQPNLIPQKLTPEALIKAMIPGSMGVVQAVGNVKQPASSKSKMEQKAHVEATAKAASIPTPGSLVPPGVGPVMTIFQPYDATGFIVADELTAFLNAKSYEAGLGQLLIQFYDCKKEWEYRSIIRGAEKIRSVCLGMLGASTVDWLRGAIPEEAVGSGLTSRIIFIYEDKPNRPVPFPTWTTEQQQILGGLAQHLNAVACLSGKMTWEPEAKDIYQAEYMDFYDKHPMYSDKLLSGYAGRRMSHLAKLCMIISAARGVSLIVTRTDVLQSRDLLSHAEQSMPRVMRLVTTSDAGSDTEYVLGIMKTRRSLKYHELAQLVGHKFTSKMLKEILDTLCAMQVIKGTFSDNNYVYTYIESGRGMPEFR